MLGQTQCMEHIANNSTHSYAHRSAPKPALCNDCTAKMLALHIMNNLQTRAHIGHGSHVHAAAAPTLQQEGHNSRRALRQAYLPTVCNPYVCNQNMVQHPNI